MLKALSASAPKTANTIRRSDDSQEGPGSAAVVLAHADVLSGDAEEAAGDTETSDDAEEAAGDMEPPRDARTSGRARR